MESLYVVVVAAAAVRRSTLLDLLISATDARDGPTVNERYGVTEGKYVFLAGKLSIESYVVISTQGSFQLADVIAASYVSVVSVSKQNSSCHRDIDHDDHRRP